MTTYCLKISFKSNILPWECIDTPLKVHQPQSDEEAKEWARSMSEGLYDYVVTLLRDGEVLNYEE